MRALRTAYRPALLRQFHPRGLSGRYLIAAMVLCALMFVAVIASDAYLTRSVSHAVDSTAENQRIDRHSRQLRDAVWNVNLALQSFMTQPSDAAHRRLDLAFETATDRVAAMERSRWIDTRVPSEVVPELRTLLVSLRRQLDDLVRMRGDPVRMHPALQIMNEQMLPANNAFRTQAALALEELWLERDDEARLALYRRMDRLRDTWNQMIGVFRVLVANRVGAFSNTESSLLALAQDVRTLHRQINEDLAQLKAQAQSGVIPFQVATALPPMRRHAQQWRSAFDTVLAIYQSPQWRTDLPYLHGSVQPLFSQLWSTLVRIEHLTEAASRENLQSLSRAGHLMHYTLWAMALVCLLAVAVGYHNLVQSVLRPLARVTHALWAYGKGVKEVDVPSAGSPEMRKLIGAFVQLRRQIEERQLALENQALHDGLTALPNRELLKRTMSQVLRTRLADNENVALCLLDLDHFKDINDTLGHAAGDHILQQVADRLLSVVPTEATVARLGGDEFAVLFPRATRAEARSLAERLCAVLEADFEVGGHRLYVGGSVGIALAPEDGDNSSELLSHADVAMYTAKNTGQDFAHYDGEQDANSIARLDLVKDLRAALQSDALELRFQPQMELVSGRIRCVEALLRWNHPRYGAVSPEHVVSIAERTGMIQDLTYWVLDAALRQWVEWGALSLGLKVAVNLSALDLQNVALVDGVAQRLEHWGVPPHALALEITEGAMMVDLEGARRALTRLHDMGVELAIDDFGTGFSSMAYLKGLPVDKLKIDKSFILHSQSDRDHAIVQSIIDLGHNLDMTVVAEGVEDNMALRRLQRMGCDRIQGYYLCRPVPSDELAQWLRARRGAGRQAALPN